MKQRKSAPEFELASPIPFHFGSNGEFVPRPPGEKAIRAEAMFRRLVDERSRKLGVSRRQFVESSCGVAAALLVINTVSGCTGDSGYSVRPSMTFDDDEACEALGGGEFIFDIQTHHVNSAGAWRGRNEFWDRVLRSFPFASCGEIDQIKCFDVENYIHEVFVNSDTTMAVLSAVPAPHGNNPLELSEQVATQEIVNAMKGSLRVVLHALILPDQGPPELDRMERLVQDYDISAWKVYTQFGTWWFDDPIGLAFLERAREVGVKRICSHKGFDLIPGDPAYASPRDVGVVANMFPDMQFLIYHSAFQPPTREGPYNAQNPQGIDRLIKSLEENGVGPNQNVYAEVGSTWRYVMIDPLEAAHVMGKLLKYVGEDNVVWGTDSIWYGTPQDQIDAFRALQIPEQLRAEFGYPELTPEIKTKIFGLNSAKVYDVDVEEVLCETENDDIAAAKRQLADRRRPTYRHYGPRTRREFFNFLRLRDGRPG